MAAPSCARCELHTESTFKVEGLDCREEVALLERRFQHLAGLEDFSADVMTQRLHVTYDAARLSAANIAGAVADAGMRAWLEHEEPIAGPPDGNAWRVTALAISGAALLAGFAAGYMTDGTALPTVLFATALASGMTLTAPKAWRSLRLRALDIHVLMTIAVTGALALGEWSEAASVVFLFAVAQALETRTLERARFAVRALMDLTPNEATIRTAHGVQSVPVEQVTPGTVIIVRPGEKVPLDGIVVSGASAINQAPVTGESLPVDKAAGDEVFAGSINGRGALDVRVTHHRQDTTLARIIHLVEQAQAQRAPAQTFVDRFARVYTPAVIALAALLAAVPPLVGMGDWSTWTYRALVLLVVSCPCALVISTPVSVVAALAGAARKGVLIKGGVHLERAAAIRCVAFDKTGTLTRGTPEVVAITPLVDASPDEVIAVAAAVEDRAAHPIAQAIVAHAADRGVHSLSATDVELVEGRGARGLVQGAPVLVGNHRLVEEAGLCSPALHDLLAPIAEEGRTPVLVARRHTVIGVISVADRPREAGRDALDLLRRQGITRIVMLTGDTAATGRAIGRELGVDEVRAELLPQDKVAALQELRAQFGPTAMVGDGVNDAPALAAADIGIVMGAIGSDAALETADVALMADELLKVPYALRLSRATARNIRMNLAISLVLKAGFVVAAAAGAATLWMAILADTGATVLVVANALRLLRAD